MSVKTFHGSCHCGAVAFEADLDPSVLTQCNCSICAKKGALHARVTKDRFRLLRGQDDLQLYQFNTRVSRHQFCRHCGIHAFANPRAAPDQVIVNARCLDDFDVFNEPFEINSVDGRNWEQHFAKQVKD